MSCRATNLLQNPAGNGFDQGSSPSGPKPLCETAFHLWAERNGEYFDQRVHRLIRLPEPFDLLNRVKNGSVVAAVIKSADLGRAPSHNVLGEVHRNLPTQTRGRLIPGDASISEMIGYRRLNLFEGQPFVPISVRHFQHLRIESRAGRK
jgi:hypothetical protein